VVSTNRDGAVFGRPILVMKERQRGGANSPINRFTRTGYGVALTNGVLDWLLVRVRMLPVRTLITAVWFFHCRERFVWPAGNLENS